MFRHTDDYETTRDMLFPGKWLETYDTFVALVEANTSMYIDNLYNTNL